MDHFPYSKKWNAFWHSIFYSLVTCFYKFGSKFCRYFQFCNFLQFQKSFSISKISFSPSSSHFFPRIAYTLVQIPSTVGRCVVTMQVRGYVSVLTLPTAKAGGFLFLPLLHWQIPYGTAMSYTVSTSYIYPVPACPAVQFFIFMQTASAVLSLEY